MLALEQTKTFKKCLKKYRYKKSVLAELEVVVKILVQNKPIPEKYKDHELKGNYKGIRELHLKSDDLLLYIKVKDKKITLMAMGSYSEIF